MDIAHPATEINHGQTVSEQFAEYCKFHQIMRLRPAHYVQFGGAAATAGILSARVGLFNARPLRARIPELIFESSF